MVEKYHNNFVKEVEANVEGGEWVKMCMQCGVCSGSCPLGKFWAHPPHEIFMMIRAGERNEVLGSDSQGKLAWACGTYVLKTADGETVQEGKWMNVSKKVKGEWLTYSDIWNTNAPD